MEYDEILKTVHEEVWNKRVAVLEELMVHFRTARVGRRENLFHDVEEV